jgi:hypothetical protein
MRSDVSSGPDLSGMTVNERLFHCGLLDMFDTFVRDGDRASMIQVLKLVKLSASDAESCVEAILADPTRYGRLP